MTGLVEPNRPFLNILPSRPSRTLWLRAFGLESGLESGLEVSASILALPTIFFVFFPYSYILNNWAGGGAGFSKPAEIPVSRIHTFQGVRLQPARATPSVNGAPR